MSGEHLQLEQLFHVLGFRKRKEKKKGSACPQLVPSSLLVTWSISGKDCVATCNLKLCSSYWGMLTRSGAFWAQMLTTILPVTPHPMQETTLHQQPLQQRFSPLPQQIHKHLQEVFGKVSSGLRTWYSCLHWETLIYFNCYIKNNKKKKVFLNFSLL